MPTYHFRCPQGHDFDKFFKTMSSAPAALGCPTCGESATRQLSGGAGLVFKGSGFYLTDYGKNAHRGSAPEKKTDAAGGAPKGESPARSEAKSDAKSDAKSESRPETPKPKADSPKPKPKSE